MVIPTNTAGPEVSSLTTTALIINKRLVAQLLERVQKRTPPEPLPDNKCTCRS